MNELDDPAKRERLQKIEKIIQQTPELHVYQRDLHLQLLLGLDLDGEKLERLYEVIKQANSNYAPDVFYSNTRWEPLKVELWCGDLSVDNDRFAGIECVIMSEVIEHLFPEQLDKSIPLLFGKYQPQWIVITTPNYEFNQHIDQYSSPESRSKHRYSDPTRRTNRCFRDSDHKFEWTIEEFKQWCQSISSAYDYDYEITGCGSYRNYFNQSTTSIEIIKTNIPKPRIPIPKVPEKFFATQIVVFERRNKVVTLRESPNPIPKNNSQNQHRLVAVEEYLAHESSNKASTTSQILECVKGFLMETGQSQVQLRELWLCNSGLDKLCGGKLIQLLIAFSDEDDWHLKVKKQSDTNPQFTGMDAIWITWLKFPKNIKNGDHYSKNRDSHWMNSWK